MPKWYLFFIVSFLYFHAVSNQITDIANLIHQRDHRNNSTCYYLPGTLVIVKIP